MITLDDDLQRLLDDLRSYARSYHPPKQPADCVRPMYADDAFAGWEIKDGDRWRRAPLPEARRVLRRVFDLRGEAIDRALGGLLGPRAKPKLDRYCRTMLGALLLDFRDKVVRDWLAVTPGLAGLSVEGLRYEFAQLHPGFEVGRSVFERIREV